MILTICIIIVTVALFYLGRFLFRIQKFKKRSKNLRQKYKDYKVVYIENYISADECDTIIKLAKSRIRPSKVLNTDNSKTSSITRRSNTCFFNDIESRKHPVIKKLRKSISRDLKINLNRFESLQVTQYNPNGYYSPHYDASLDSERGNRRSDTVIIYLNDDFTGGTTDFPMLGQKYKAKRRAALFFKNMLNPEKLHPLALHAGTPVKEGEKWICNQWIKYSNMES